MAKVTAEAVGAAILNSTAEIKSLINKILQRTDTPHGREAMGRILNKLEQKGVFGTTRDVIEVDRIIRRALSNYINNYMTDENADIDSKTADMIEKLIDKRSAMCTISFPLDRSSALKAFKKKNRFVYARKELKKEFDKEQLVAADSFVDYAVQIEKAANGLSLYSLETMQLQNKKKIEEANRQIDGLVERFRTAKNESEQEQLNLEYQAIEDELHSLLANEREIQLEINNIKNEASIDTRLSGMERIKRDSTYNLERHKAKAKKVREESKKRTEQNRDAASIADSARVTNASFLNDTAGLRMEGAGLAARVAREDARNLTVEAGVAARSSLADLAAERDADSAADKNKK